MFDYSKFRENYYLRLTKIEQTEAHRWRVTATNYRISHGVTVTAYTTDGVAVEAVSNGGNWYYNTAEEAARELWFECMAANKLGRSAGRPRKVKPPRIDGAKSKIDRNRQRRPY